MDTRRNAYLLNEKGCELCEQGRYESAIEVLREATELDPSNTDAWYSQAGCLYSLGRFAEALSAYVQVLKLNPGDQMAKRMAIVLEDESGYRNSDLNTYLNQIECYGFGVEVQGAYEAGKEEKIEGAIAFYNKAIELDASFSGAYNSRGVALRKLGRHQDALRDYERAVELKPGNAIAWYNRGQCLRSLTPNDPDSLIGALECFEKAIEIDPTDVDVLQAIAGLRELGFYRDDRGGLVQPTRTQESELEPVYLVVLKAERLPTEDEMLAALLYFSEANALESPASNARIAAWCDPEMPTRGVDGAFMIRVGTALVAKYPELRRYILSRPRFARPQPKLGFPQNP